MTIGTFGKPFEIVVTEGVCMYVELDDIKNIFTVLIKSDVVMLEFNGIFLW